MTDHPQHPQEGPHNHGPGHNHEGVIMACSVGCPICFNQQPAIHKEVEGVEASLEHSREVFGDMIDRYTGKTCPTLDAILRGMKDLRKAAFEQNLQEARLDPFESYEDATSTLTIMSILLGMAMQRDGVDFANLYAHAISKPGLN